MSTVEAPTPRLKERYVDEIRPALQESLGLSSAMAVPRLEKITLNMGVGEAKTNAKALDEAAEQLAIIAGQRPVITRAKKSIAGFKIRGSKILETSKRPVAGRRGDGRRPFSFGEAVAPP